MLRISIKNKERQKNGFPEGVLNIWKSLTIKLIKNRRTQLEKINESEDLIRQIAKNGLTAEPLSYIISTTNIYKLPHRLMLINDYLSNMPANQE